MSRPRWQEVKALFQAALERDADDRDAFLETACAGDGALRAEVASLLASDADELPWLDRPVFEAAAGLLASDPTAGAGSRIGPYGLVRELGRGGMGRVFLAARADGAFEQQVAVKLLRRGMDSDDLVRRFRQERQILASLDHPHIARLLDGGVTAAGEPYLVMEYVDGEPLDAYCARRRLAVTARVELFRAVCSAVHFAHRHLVVHCDLKASNVLVTAGGVPKLLDFGVAKLLGSEHVPRLTGVTAPGLRLMTPDYASPEQVRGEGVTTASDVYSLGVLLYEVLTGRLPYRLASRSPREVERVICEQEPARPSSVAGASGVEPGGLVGDLDNVVLMALHKDPGRRYGSVEQLAEDLRRHLAGLPVLAHTDSWRYRAGKFVRRHRLEVVAAALTALSLLAGMATTAWQAREARTQRENARVQQAAAEQVADFLARLLQQADPRGRGGETVTVREALDQGAALVERELRDQPLVQARMMDTIGVAYHNLGLYDAALPLLEKALATRRRLLGDAPEVAKSLDALGSLLQARGDYGAAEPLLREALALRRRLLGEATPEVAESLNNVALLLRDKGEYDAAEPLYRQALERYRELLGERSVEVAMARHNLGGLLRLRGDYDEAERHLRAAVAIYRELLGEGHPHVASGLNTLAVLLRNKGDYDEAERAYREVLELQRRSLGGEHPDVARTLSNLGALLAARGDAAAAEPLFVESLALYRRVLGEGHPEAANPLHHLGLLRQGAGDLAAAESYLDAALDIRRQALGTDHPTVAISALALGKALMDRGDAGRAEALLREALRIREARLPPGDWRTGSARGVLGGCLAALGRYREAEPLLLDGHRTLVAERGPDDPRTRETAAYLAGLYEAWGRPAQAAAYRESAGL